MLTNQPRLCNSNPVSSLLGIMLIFVVVPLSAQEIQIRDLQRNIEIFSGVLEEALDLSQGLGLFGMSLGGVESTYLYGQGVVIEVRSPLANRRHVMGLASINSALQSLQPRGNPFERLRQPSIPIQNTPVMPLAVANGFYRQMMERISHVDYSLMVNSAIQQASEAARSLRSLGSVDDSGYEDMRSDLDDLRDQMQSNMEELREIEANILRLSNQAAPATGDQTSGVAAADQSLGLQTRLDELIIKIELLKDQAVAKAEEFRQRSDEAERVYAARWQEDVIAFESSLYAAMCDYGSTLRELSIEESISVILRGLGDESAGGRRRDKVHVFAKSDVLQCQSGDIGAASLQQQSVQYNY
ncbi:MAG TPA: hypothetical protein EYG31_03420 [Porticoccaceae bacterium]|jgi:hypothetical protein|nr:hypothetical protein [Gammaproteobacteria bacterium]HIL59671.1 hypothetical protein [Porticoccaceae bacterium]